MASLPPRPDTPPKLREEHLHHDDRDRDRRPAQPMSRISRPLPERERSYVPSRRPDTYIPGHDSRRDGDRRDHSRERERDRYRDIDRERDRERRRDRDYDRSPRKWELSDRERRAYDRDRGPYRRPLSPIRRSGPSRRDSRSPPRRRPPLRSPSPYRSRPRSRTRSPRRSPAPSKRVRLGNHSINTSPRSRSPRRRSRSRDRSMSIDKGPSTSAVPPSINQQTPDISGPTRIPDVEQEGDIQAKLSEDVVQVKLEEQPVHILSQDSKPNLEAPQYPTSDEVKSSILGSSQTRQSSPEADTNVRFHPKLEGVKTERTEATVPISPARSKGSLKLETAEDVISKKMDIVDSPKQISKRSPSPQLSRSDHLRPAVTIPQRIWSGRSPPRGPRNFPRPQQSHLQYSSGRREPRRSYYAPGQSGYGKSEPDVKLPVIPKLERSKVQVELAAMEIELAKMRTVRLTHAHQGSNQIKGLQRALHELDMASIDLHAAEGRRRVADAQLERAKTGTLGIDAPDLIDV